ncbi:MAG: oligosaccharide flippase family protein [Anaeroplasma sp.]
MHKKLKNLSYILIMSIIIKALGLLYKIITTRFLGLEGMRLMSMIMPMLSLCLSLSSFSIQAVCNQTISLNITTKENKTSIIMLSCLRVTLISSSIVAILMLLSFPIYKYIYNESFIYYPLLLCIPLIYLSNTSGVMKGYLEANNKFSITYASNVIESIAKLFLSAILLIILRDYSIKIQVTICFFTLMVSEITSCIFLSIKIKKGKKINLRTKTNKYEYKIFKQALPLTLESLLTTLVGYITPFIFYFAAEKNSFSLYDSTCYYTLVSAYAIPLLINGQFSTLTLTKLIFPNVTKNRNNPKLNDILNQAIYIIIFFSIISFTLCYYQGELLLNVLYKDSQSYDMVKIMAPIYVFLYFDPLFIMILQAFNKEKLLFGISLISHLISMLLIYFLTISPSILLKGYILGLSIGALVKCILLMITSLKICRFNPSLAKIFTAMFLSIIYIVLVSTSTSITAYCLLTLLFLSLGLLFYYFFYNKNLFFQLDSQHI